MAGFQFGGNGFIGKDALYAGLGIVEVALDSVDLDVAALLGSHLQMLDLAGAGVGVKDLDLNAVQVRITGQGSLAGIAGGRHQEAGVFGAAQVLFGLDQQFGHQLQGVVLERAGGAVPQFQRVNAVTDLDGLARLAAEYLAISGGGGAVQEVGAVIGQETFEYLLGQGRVGQGLPTFQICLGEGFRHKQAAFGCQTAHDRLGRRNTECGISGTLKLHIENPPIF